MDSPVKTNDKSDHLLTQHANDSDFDERVEIEQLSIQTTLVDKIITDEQKTPMVNGTSHANHTENKMEIECEKQELLTSFQIWKNLFVVSLSFLFMFSALYSFSNLQSTLNKEGGLGTTGLSLIYVTRIFTSLFITVFTMSRISNKWTIVVSMAMHIGYVATGYYASWSTVIPASVILGIGGTHLWSAKQAYVTDLAKQYALSKKMDLEHALNLLFGVFFGMFFTTQIWGNLFSSLLLHHEPPQNTSLDMNNQECGIDFCPHSDNQTQINQPSKNQLYTYISFCVGLSCLAVVTSALFLSNIKGTQSSRMTLATMLKSVFRHMTESRTQQLLMVSSIYRGMSSAFVIGDFTVAFISCPLGVSNVGFVMIAYGISSSILSFSFGKLAKYSGHLILFVIAFITQASVCITALLWRPDPNKAVVIYILSALWAVGDAVYMPYLTSLYSLHFKRNSAAAFSAYRLLDSFGWAITFGLSGFVCVRPKIILLLSMMTLSLSFLIILHVFQKKKQPGASV